MQGVTLAEKLLDKSCAPYETFRMSRFMIKEKDVPALLQLMKDCTEIQQLKDEEAERVLREQFEIVE